jgi:hypothetical protein
MATAVRHLDTDERQHLITTLTATGAFTSEAVMLDRGKEGVYNYLLKLYPETIMPDDDFKKM